jgi:hypothetical protein
MLGNLRRLHPRGSANWGICVDAEGAMLGPDCVLVRRTSRGFRGLDREVALRLQKLLMGADRDRDWVFRRCQSIADALERGEVALAQIHGLRIPIAELDDWQLKRIALVAFARAGFNPDEPRIPKGDPNGGEWTSGNSEAVLGSDSSPLPILIGNDNPQQTAGGPGDITFGHGARHVDDPAAVEATIRDALSRALLSPGFNSGAVNVNGRWYQYRAYLLPGGGIHVGTYFPW